MPKPVSEPEHTDLDQIAAALDGCLIALDFDGTLAPFTTDPDRSAPAAGAVDTLSRLARAGAQIAIVTGRDALTALRLSGLQDIDNLVVSGLHGAQTYRDQKLRSQDEPAGIAALRTSLPPVLRAVDEAAWLEDKGLSLVVHARRSATPQETLDALEPAVTRLAGEAGLEVHPGHLVWEIRIAGVNKGDAIGELLAPDTSAAVFAGDDHGDLPAVRAVNAWGAATGRPAVSIAVGSLPALREQASMSVADPDALIRLLGRLLPTS